MASIFSRIADGEIPSYRVAADDRHYAFLDINPVAEGHVLVIPRKEVDYIFDLTESEYADLQLFTKRVADAIRRTFDCKKVGMAVLGLEVPHAHIHLVPLNSESDMDFRAPKKQLSPERMAEIAGAIAANFK